jgi:hypothetical protein
MRDWLADVAVGLGLATLVVLLLLFASFDSTFMYRGF